MLDKKEILESNWTIPVISGLVTIVLLFLIITTARTPERPQDPNIVPVTRPRFRPGTVVYTDSLPKPIAQPSSEQLQLPRRS
jgi:hypothetical protein